MINGLEGIPGSGKSYEAVVYHVLPALKAGRKVITNLPLNIEAFCAIDSRYKELIEVRTQPEPIRGTWDASNIAKQPAFSFYGDGHVEEHPVSVFVFGSVWDYYSSWRGKGGLGPLFVIDECHVSLPKFGTPKSIVEWFKLHRHFNADVLLITQSFRDIDQSISTLLATLIKCRKADILGKSDQYIRKVHAGYRGALIQQDEREYQQQFFGLYKSHTQGQSIIEQSASDVSPFVVKFNRFKWGFILFSLIFAIWAFWPNPDENLFGFKEPPKNNSPLKSPQNQSPLPANLPVSSPSSSLPAPPPSIVKEDEPIEPLSGKQLHLTGSLKMGSRSILTFVLSSEGRRLFELTSVDLFKMGYNVTTLADCVVWLDYGKNRRPVTCDAPVIADGQADRPVVFDSGLASWSDGRDKRPGTTEPPPRSAGVTFISSEISAPGSAQSTLVPAKPTVPPK